MKIDWKSKLTSRKFWMAVVGFVTAICIVFGVDEMTVEQIVGLITAGSMVVAYIIGEGIVDSNR
jgi:uncharacterized membrane protein